MGPPSLIPLLNHTYYYTFGLLREEYAKPNRANSGEKNKKKKEQLKACH